MTPIRPILKTALQKYAAPGPGPLAPAPATPEMQPRLVPPSEMVYNGVKNFFNGGANQPSAAPPAMQPRVVPPSEMVYNGVKNFFNGSPNPPPAGNAMHERFQPPNAAPPQMPQPSAAVPEPAPQAPPPVPPAAPAPAPTATQPATTTPPTAPTPPPANQPATMMPLADGSSPSRGAFLTGREPQKLTTQDYDGYTKQLQTAQTPEAKQQVIQDMTTRIKPGLNEADTAGANDVLAGNMDSPAAQQFVKEKLGPTGESYRQSIVQQELAKQPEKANDPGFFGQAQGMAAQMWNSMGPMGQLAMTFGIPAALIGLMGGGGLTALLGGLGIGALGLGAAGMGLFGEGAQKGVGDLSYNVGQFLGMIPSGKQDLSTLVADDPVQAAVAQSDLGFGSSTADVKAKVQDSLAKKQQLQSLINAPVPDNIKAQWLMKMDPERIKTPEDAMRALRGAGTLVSAFDDPNSAIAQKIQDGQAYTDGGNSWYGRAGQLSDAVSGIRKTLPSGTDVWNTVTNPSSWNWFGRQGVKQFHAATSHDYLQPYITRWATKTAFNDVDAKELSDLKAEKAKGAPYRVDDARREHALNLRRQSSPASSPKPKVVKKQIIVMCMKSARCWAGYEPVPGKKPYSNDSCRPIRSKKQKTDKKKKAAT